VRLRLSSSGLLAGLLGVSAALLVSCGSSSGKLIPVADAGPLQSDFETVAQAAEAGNGNCSATEAAILTTEQDFNTLPTGVDTGLRNTLRQPPAPLPRRLPAPPPPAPPQPPLPPKQPPRPPPRRRRLRALPAPEAVLPRRALVKRRPAQGAAPAQAKAPPKQALAQTPEWAQVHRKPENERR